MYVESKCQTANTWLELLLTDFYYIFQRCDVADNLAKCHHTIPCGGRKINWVAQPDAGLESDKKATLVRCGLFDTDPQDTIGICQDHFSYMHTNFAANFSGKDFCHYHQHDSRTSGRNRQLVGSNIPLVLSRQLFEACDLLVPHLSFVCNDCIDKIYAAIQSARQAGPAGPNSPSSNTSSQPQAPFAGYRNSQSLYGSSSSSSSDEDDLELTNDSVDRVYVYMERDQMVSFNDFISENFQFTRDFSNRGIPKGSALGKLLQ